VIYPILAGSKLNNDIAVDFRDKLQRSRISFLIDESEAETYLSRFNKEYKNSGDINLKNWFIQPYFETMLMVNESVNLIYSFSEGNVKLNTVGSARKDRYTSCSYGNYFISLLELELLKQSGSDYDYVFDYS